MKEKIPIAQLLLIIFIFANIASVSIPVSATSVDKLSICNIEGHAGDVIDIPITLKSTSDSQRLGQWSTFYKKVEGKGEGESDDEKMDITSWITITPANYTLKPGEAKIFTVRISIPRNAKQGLYGATSEDADMEGHSGERRTYIIFEDADALAAGAGGSAVQSGMLIPVSVKVLERESSFDVVKEAVKKNNMLILLCVIIILISAFVVIARRKKRQR